MGYASGPRRPQAIGAAVAMAGMVVVSTATAPPTAAAGYVIITTVAGNGGEFSSGDGGPATQASLGGPADVVVDAAGNLYIVEEWGQRVRKVDPSGIITTVAGDGTTGQCDWHDRDCDPFGPPPDVGDGGPATEAHLNQPSGVAVDGAQNVYIADSQNARVRRVDAASGVITTVAGTGQWGSWGGDNGDGGPATEASLAGASGVALDAAETTLYIAEGGAGNIRAVDLATGIITTFAGTGDAWGSGGDGGPATDAQLWFPNDVDLDGAGNVFISEVARLRKVDATTGIITTVAGNGDERAGFSGDGGPATEAGIDPRGVSVDASGNLYIADAQNHRIRKVDAFSGIITTVAGGGTPVDGLGDGGPPTEGRLAYPQGLHLDDTMGLLIADTMNYRVRQVVTVPDLLLIMKSDAPDPLNIDQQLTYTIDVTNNSTGTATGVTLTDSLPAEVSFNSATATQGSCSQANGTVTCALGEMAAGATATVTIVVTPTTPGMITNTATVNANEDDPFPGNDTAVAETAVGDRGCGQVITRTTRLSEDIGPCPADGVVVGRDGITVNLGGYGVFGFDGPGDGNSAGIRLPDRSRVRVLNGTVSGFDGGVVLDGGRANTVTNMTVRDNVGPDDPFNAELGDGIILFDSAANLIVHNVVAGNGIFDGIGVLGGEADGNVIRNNTVTDNVGPSDGGPAGQGIIVNAAGLGDNTGSVIQGTVIEGNVIRGSGSAGISNMNNIGAQILDNVVEGNGLTNWAGNGIGIQLGPRSEMPFTRALVQGNQVHGNGLDGIHVQRGATENRIIDNNAADNNARSIPWFRGFDLHDLNRDPEAWRLNCYSNTWSGNVWGHAYYNPPCTAAGGSGPPLPPPEPEVYGEPSCFDDWDNDQDGLTDYEDPDCHPTEGPDAGAGSCGDGLDNDGDGATDHEDEDCWGRIIIGGSPAATSGDASTTAETESPASGADETHMEEEAERLPPTRRGPPSWVERGHGAP